MALAVIGQPRHSPSHCRFNAQSSCSTSSGACTFRSTSGQVMTNGERQDGGFAERYNVKAMRDRRRARGLRELRLVIPDSRRSQSWSVMADVATEVAMGSIALRCAIGEDRSFELACRRRPRDPGEARGRQRPRAWPTMRRGDVVTVAAAGDYGKPRPAVIVQTDAFPETRARRQASVRGLGSDGRSICPTHPDFSSGRSQLMAKQRRNGLRVNRRQAIYAPTSALRSHRSA